MVTTLQLGRVAWFGGHNNKTGRNNDFGFISHSGQESIFVHKSSLTNCSVIEEGELVLFSLSKGKKGIKEN